MSVEDLNPVALGTAALEQDLACPQVPIRTPPERIFNTRIQSYADREPIPEVCHLFPTLAGSFLRSCIASARWLYRITCICNKKYPELRIEESNVPLPPAALSLPSVPLTPCPCISR